MKTLIVTMVMALASLLAGKGTLAVSPSSSPPSCLKIGTIDALDPSWGVMDFGRRVFKEAGICVQFMVLPVRRAEQMTLAGMLDGELKRGPECMHGM